MSKFSVFINIFLNETDLNIHILRQNFTFCIPVCFAVEIISVFVCFKIDALAHVIYFLNLTENENSIQRFLRFHFRKKTHYELKK